MIASDVPEKKAEWYVRWAKKFSDFRKDMPQSKLDARYKKLFDRLKATMRVRHYSIRTERAYEQWIRRFLSFHKTKAVEKIGAKDIESYLN